jgi:hypothetical protein
MGERSAWTLYQGSEVDRGWVGPWEPVRYQFNSNQLAIWVGLAHSVLMGDKD